MSMIASGEKNTSSSRRDFFKKSVFGLGVALGAPSLLSAQGTKTNGLIYGGYGKIKIGSLKELKEKGELDFAYPDATSLCKAVYVNHEAKAYSIICTHKGCPTVYEKSSHEFICPCHHTKYDAENEGQMIIGHATGKLPQVRLEIEGDAIYAIGVDGLIFGRIANVLS